MIRNVSKLIGKLFILGFLFISVSPVFAMHGKMQEKVCEIGGYPEEGRIAIKIEEPKKGLVFQNGEINFAKDATLSAKKGPGQVEIDMDKVNGMVKAEKEKQVKKTGYKFEDLPEELFYVHIFRFIGDGRVFCNLTLVNKQLAEWGKKCTVKLDLHDLTKLDFSDKFLMFFSSRDGVEKKVVNFVEKGWEDIKTKIKAKLNKDEACAFMFVAGKNKCLVMVAEKNRCLVMLDKGFFDVIGRFFEVNQDKLVKSLIKSMEDLNNEGAKRSA